MALLSLTVAVLFLVIEVNSDTKVWIYTSDISDPNNWETNAGAAPQGKCDGLIFSERTDADVTIEQLEVKRLTLPSWGQLNLISGSKIVFDEYSTKKLNCVKLKPMDIVTWHKISGWNNTDDPDNPAVPYVERLPSRFDDIIFPSKLHSNIEICTHLTLEARSVTIGQGRDKIKLSRNQLLYGKLNSEFPGIQDIQISNKKCVDVTGCASKLNVMIPDDSCASVLSIDHPPRPNCQDPIWPTGFCSIPQCGASIVINSLKTGFRLDKINKKLKKYASYTHANKISDESLQIFFTEKGFTGQSIVDAIEFHNLLLEDSSYNCGNIILETSGPPLYEQGWHMKTALSIAFGTLMAVIVMFALLFVIYSPTVGNMNIRNRLLGNRPISTYILRYANIEDRGYIVEGQSIIASSTVNLSKSFENPLYEGQSSSRSTSSETIASIKLGRPRDEIKGDAVEEVDADLEDATEVSEAAVIEEEVEDVKDDNILLKDI